MIQGDIYRLHALCCAAIGRSWAETDIVIGSEVVTKGLVEFSAIGAPSLTPEGKNVLREAIAGMKGTL